jgi:hypothetical protein
VSTPTERLDTAIGLALAAGGAQDDEPAVAVADLGDTAELVHHAAALAAHPDAHIVASALARAGAEADEALRGFSAHLKDQRSPLALLETVDALLADERVVQVQGAHLHDVLLPSRAEQASEPHLAAIRVEACVRLVLLGVRSPWGVIGALSDATEQPPEHQQRLPRLIGALLDASGGSVLPTETGAPLRSALTALATAGHPDAKYEVAVDRLRLALELAAAEVPKAVRAAVDQLHAVARDQENRFDATTLASAGQALLALHDRDLAAVRAAANAAQQAADTIALHLRGMHVRPWTAARRATQAGWLTFADDLTRLSEELEHDSFLNTDTALVVVGNAYARARAVSPGGPGTNTIVCARIENDVARRGAMLGQLERALDLDRRRDQPLLPEGVALLAQALREHTSGARAPQGGHRTGAAEGASGEEGDPELVGRLAPPPPSEPLNANATEATPATVAEPPVALRQVFGRARASALLRDNADPQALERVADALLQDDVAGLLPDDDPIVGLMEERLLEELSTNVHFTGLAAQRFWRLTRLTVRFVRRSLDVTAPYLRPYGSRKQAPHEVQLQRHFLEWLALFVPGQFREVPDVGTGRADIMTVFGDGVEFITEVKREFHDVRPQALEDAYFGQAASYQATRLPLGGLLTLDLTAHTDVVAHLLDLVWVAHHTPQNSTVKRTVLCAVVVGNRPPPSSTRRS